MSFLDKRHMSHRGSMQGHYKYTDGFSDRSSAGSFMDETDREVSNLTDRAFRSLCIGEEAIYNDSDFSSSPPERHRTFIEDNQNHEILKRTAQERFSLSVKRCAEVERNAEGAATFQQSVINRSAQEHLFKSDAASQLSNGAIGTAWQQENNASRVSSLIKAFNIAENEFSITPDSMQDVLAATKNDRVHKENHSESWDKSALLSIQKELSEFSDAYHQNFMSCKKSVAPDSWKKANHLAPSRNNFHSSEVAATQKSNMDCSLPSKNPSKTKGSKSSRGKKLNSRNSFLHSEFSPFQSWKDYIRFPFEREEVADILPTVEVPKWYDSPLYKELTAEHRIQTPPTVEKKPNRKQVVEVIPANQPSATVMQKALALEKRCESEMAANCPPWRRNRDLIKNKPALQRPCTVSPLSGKPRGKDEGLLSVSKATPIHHKVCTVLDEQTSNITTPSFNISKLLTPVIHARQETETSEILQYALSPPAIDLTALGESEVRTLPENKLRDNYKAMASSLLFNLKDNRKRVKSKYSPTTFKSQEVLDRSKQPSKQEVVSKTIPMISEIPAAGVSSSGQPKAKDVPSVTSPVLRTINKQTADHKNDADARISDDYLTLISPQTVEEAANYKCFNNVIQESAVSKDQSAESESGKYSGSQMTPCPRSNEIMPRKRPEYPSLKLYKKENTLEEEIKETLPVVTKPRQSAELREGDNARKQTGRQNVNGLHSSLPTPSLPLQDNGIRQNHAFHSETSKGNVSTKSSKEAYLLVEEASEQNGLDRDVKAESTLLNLDVTEEKSEVTKVVSEEVKKELEKVELEYYALSNHEGESESKDRLGASPQREESTPWKEVTETSPSGLEAGGWVHCLIDYAQANTPVPISTVSSPSLAKLNMFKIKDNTFKTSPVIKAVKPPLHKALPEETAPKENFSGSEKAESEQDQVSERSDNPTVNEIPVLNETPLPEEIPAPEVAPSAEEVPATDALENILESNSVPEREESHVIVTTVSEEVECGAANTADAEKKVAASVNAEETEGSKDVSERSDSVCSANENKPLGKPPAVPPKTEKALRRAKKLTNRRKKVDLKPKVESTSKIEKKPMRTVSSVPSSPTRLLSSPLPVSIAPSTSLVHLEPSFVPSAPNIVALNGAQPIQPFPLTQRKLLQDPESGQYFVVDMPVQVKTKTFFDPETGKYVQLSIRSAEGGLSHASSLEVLNPPYMLYPGFLPLPVTSLPTLRSSSQMSAPAALMDDQEKVELSESWMQDMIKQNYNRESQPYIEPAYESHNQITEESLYSEGKESVSPRNLDIISMSELEDFAVESIS
ncbi:cardiac-enriched FHL2-interacting protein [Amia ocellicauda]|uniref:cardiac-enriched FHL2-interacting protein n=1 Tax=Amia ocellicauda TaxID=2972642 RepID=UPI003463F96D